MGAVFAAVCYVEVVAHRVGERLGRGVLAGGVAVIETLRRLWCGLVAPNSHCPSFCRMMSPVYR